MTIDAARAGSSAAGDADAYRHEVDDVLGRLETTPAGLTSAQADTHRARFGSNEIVTLKRESTLRRYLRQYKDWMIVLLLASATVTAVLGDYGTAAVSCWWRSTPSSVSCKRTAPRRRWRRSRPWSPPAARSIATAR